MPYRMVEEVSPREEPTKTFDITRKYGVEIECVFGRESDKIDAMKDLKDEFEALGDGEGYYECERDNNQWHLKSDSSLTGGYDLEVVSPVLTGISGFHDIKKITDTLEFHNAEVNTSCGLHIHQDARNLPDKAFVKVYDFYKKNQESIDMLLPKSRRVGFRTSSGTPFNSPLGNLELGSYEQLKDQLTRGRFGRHTVINFRSYSLRGSIEFRQHSGTLKPHKIINWIVFTQAIINWARSTQETPFSYVAGETLASPLIDLKWFNLDIDNYVRQARNWILTRMQRFSNVPVLSGVPEGVATEAGLRTITSREEVPEGATIANDVHIEGAPQFTLRYSQEES
jgi:hypothetical protein